MRGARGAVHSTKKLVLLAVASKNTKTPTLVQLALTMSTQQNILKYLCKVIAEVISYFVCLSFSE